MTRPYKPRGPSYDYWIGCPGCGAEVGVRAIRAGLHLVAIHSTGKARRVGPDLCAGAELEVSAMPRVTDRRTADQIVLLLLGVAHGA